jgi:hypothetical protein
MYAQLWNPVRIGAIEMPHRTADGKGSGVVAGTR